MSLTLQKGSEGKFIEIEQNEIQRRFIVPNIPDLEARVFTLMEKYPGLSLVRVGRAIVASQDESNELKDGLEGVPSSVESAFTIDLCGDHPVLGQGPARYSLELIKEITSAEPQSIQSTVPNQMSVFDLAETQEEEEKPALSLPSAPKKSLAEQLREQVEEQKKPAMTLEQALAKKKSESVAEKSELEIVTKSDNALVQTEPIKPTEEVTVIKKEEDPAIEDAQEKLNAAIEKSKSNRKVSSSIRIMEPKPQGKLDILLEKVERIESALTGIPAGNVTGEELKSWFWSHHDTIGADKTFAILASRLKK